MDGNLDDTPHFEIEENEVIQNDDDGDVGSDVISEDNLEFLRKVNQNLLHCTDAMSIEHDYHKIMLDSTEYPKLVSSVEDCLLNLACSGVVEAIFYANVERCLISVDHSVLFCRYFEFGPFTHFHEIFHSDFAKKVDQTIYPCAIFTKEDIMEKLNRDNLKYSSRRKEQSTKQNNAMTFHRQMSRNKNNLTDSFEKLLKHNEDSTGVQLVFAVVCVLHKNRKFDPEKESLGGKTVFYCSESDSTVLEGKLLQFRLAGPSSDRVFTLGMESSQISTLVDQYRYLSLVPNYHHWQWEKENSQYKFEQRFSACNRHPGSPRNRIIQAIMSRPDNHLLTFCITKCIMGMRCEIPYRAVREANMKRKGTLKGNRQKKTKSDKNSETNESSDLRDEDSVDDDNISLTDIPSNTVPRKVHQSNFKESLYLFYCGQLMSIGIFRWRLNAPTEKILLMNDIDKNGNFKKFQHVHTRAIINSSGFFDISCTCELFGACLRNDSEEVLHQCVHCRLVADVLCNEDQRPHHLRDNFLNDSFDNIETRCLEIEAKGGVRKFSTVGNQTTSFVTLFTIQGSSKEVVQCHSSICNMGKKSKREISYLQNADVCEHLNIFHQHMISNPQCFENIETTLEENNFLPRSKWDDVFDEVSGMYTFGKNAPSTQVVPAIRNTEEMKECLIKRDLLIVGDYIEFSPPVPTVMCECSSGWVSEESPDGVLKLSAESKLYTDTRVYLIHVFDRYCLSNNCIQRWTGEVEHIYRSSHKIAAGYEIGWEYVESVNNSKQTFNGFVNIMNARYQSRGKEFCFMSLPTFIDWWFGWASHMLIEFRVQCPWCDGIENLACDGTKLGMALANAFVEPIETPQIEDTIKTKLRRHDRSFIVTKEKKNAGTIQQLRNHLKYVCSKVLGKTAENIPEEENLRLTNLLRISLPTSSIAAFDAILDNHTVSQEEKIALANHFYQLSYDCSIDTFLPFCEVKEMLSFIDKCRTGVIQLGECLAFSNRQHSFNREIAEMISISSLSAENERPRELILNHLENLAKMVERIHENDVAPVPSEVIPHTYNPCKFGRAFYFHDHGMQLRKMRKFSIDNERASKNNYDDDPIEICKKNYPQVSTKGSTFIFLWFCPNHGHCYGFHVIPGSEGRKDPAAALYTHIEKAPKNIFYDHACSLSEYVKNRESGFFKETRFFHDVFHGFSHKCSSSFRASKINLFDQTNTSICEQFNAYLQRIKASSKHLTQAHFTFYLQFFIHQWNIKQKERFEKMNKFRMLGNTSSNLMEM